MITHLFSNSRASHGIMQGLLEKFHQVFANIDFVSKGKVLVPKSDFIFDCLKKSEIIFMNDRVFFHDFLNKENLWDKVIFYDYRDSLRVVDSIPNHVAYFKRSIFLGNDRKPIKFKKKVYPITHCALKEYFIEDKEKIYDIGCFFDIANINLGIRRKNLLCKLLEYKPKNSLIGKSTGFANQARLSINSQVENNMFYDFLEIQNKCKIIFTAQPEFVEGDNRTWEALASGGLVFCERPIISNKFPLVDGVHCIFFNASSDASIKDAINKAKFYLKNDLAREKIAKQGKEFIKNHHMGIHRVEQMLNVKKIKIL